MSLSPAQGPVDRAATAATAAPQKYGLQNPNTMVGKIEAISNFFLKVVAFFFYAVFNVVFVLLPLLFDHIINGTKPTPPSNINPPVGPTTPASGSGSVPPPPPVGPALSPLAAMQSVRDARDARDALDAAEAAADAAFDADISTAEAAAHTAALAAYDDADAADANANAAYSNANAAYAVAHSAVYDPAVAAAITVRAAAYAAASLGWP